MTTPLDLRHLKTREEHGEAEGTLNRFAIAILIVAAFIIFFMLYTIVNRPYPPPSIREITPAERKQISYLEDKFKLHGYTWAIDIQTGEISYYRKGVWRVIK